MSWDNVTGVSTAYIWTDNPDMTQAYLFANGNHQVKVTVGVSFNLQGEGPTEDEVKAALSLLNYNTGTGISHLQSVEQGEYLSVYLPNMPEQPKAMADSSGKAYQYEFDYYLSSNSDINPNFSSEQVAVLISYTNADGKTEYSTASDSSRQSYVAVAVYPPKKYGMPNSGLTPVIFTIIDDQFKIDETLVSGWINHLYEPSATLYGIRIDDSYFIFSQFKVDNSLLAPNAFIQHTITNFSDDNDYNYVFAHSFFPQENHLYLDNEYDASMYIMSSDSEILVEYTGHFTQQSGEILIARIYNEVIYAKGGPDAIASSNNKANITAYDQFGNAMDILIDGHGDGYPELVSVA
ncbi:hypothetical protein [Pseudescherichia sp.]|uniref:hypothetical protein n=1 Tax=Pseudescherichia sp. TaxID=2055881 RepID=UPI0028A0105D|nr:hypothetical protein [Pseudescherichia sp.]